ncbi:MAG: tetratricopeptide repeat protein [Nitrospinae bacterium]|nr:tetratricopeptide repeat protein [Nitrospinota bacterium]
MKSTQKVICCAFLLMAALFSRGIAAGESFNSKIEQANHHYQQQEYDAAASKFLSAEVDRPDNPALAYNLANSAYKAENYEEAIEAYSRAESVADDPELKQKALYNTGNALYRMGKPEEAIASYKKALEIDPGDMDAKFNIEYIRDQLKKQKQKQDQDKKEQTSRNEKHKGESSGKDKKENKEDKQQENEKDGDKETEQEPTTKQARQKDDRELENDSSTPPPAGQEPNGKRQDGGGQPSQDIKDSDTLSEEDAERWLSSLSEDHKKFFKRQNQGKMKDLFNYKGNDW